MNEDLFQTWAAWLVSLALVTGCKSDAMSAAPWSGITTGASAVTVPSAGAHGPDGGAVQSGTIASGGSASTTGAAGGTSASAVSANASAEDAGLGVNVGVNVGMNAPADAGPARARVLSSGSTCPPNSTLTYDSFGKPFLKHYCFKCHAPELIESKYKAVPVRHFENLETIRMLVQELDAHAAAGPARTNVAMPPIDPKPTMEERLKLGEWLACGAP